MFTDLIQRVKEIRLQFTVTALLEIVLGVVLLIWPLTVVGMLAKLVGIIIIVIGVVELLAKLFDDVGRAIGIVTGLACLIVGGWILYHPAGVISIIPIVIGIGLVVHGIQNFSLAMAAKDVNVPNWGWMLVVSIVMAILGLVCIFCAIRVVDIAMRLGGIFMIVDGLTSIFMVRRVNRAERDIDSVITKEIDV